MKRYTRGFLAPILVVMVLAGWASPSLAYSSASSIHYSIDGNKITLAGKNWASSATAQSDPSFVNSNVVSDVNGSDVNGYYQNIVAWIGSKNNAYTVFMATYEPYRNLIEQQTLGPYEFVAGLTANDGVVSFISTQGAQVTFYFATYDPRYYTLPGGATIGGFKNGNAALDANSQTVNQHGVVAWTKNSSTFGKTFYAAVYDPSAGPFFGDWVKSTIEPGPYSGIGGLSVNQYGTVVATTPGEVLLGYQPATRHWGNAETKGLSYVVCLPMSGPRPLYVWNTDMSIGATNWAYDFGDGQVSLYRSDLHIYRRKGNHTLTQAIIASDGLLSSSRIIQVQGPLDFLPLLLLDK
jgi:hypothetical protein